MNHLVACVVSLIAGSEFAHGQQPVDLRVVSYSDSIDPIVTKVQVVKEGGGKATANTDVNGYTSFLSVETNELLMVYQKQKTLPSGIALGQGREWVVPDPMVPLADGIGWSLTLTQPMLEPVLLTLGPRTL